MSYVVTLVDLLPPARDDGLPWTGATIGEAPSQNGPFSTIVTFTFGSGGIPAPDSDPANPQARSFTTAQATLPSGWYLPTLADAAGDTYVMQPIAYPPPPIPSELLYCDLADVLAREPMQTVTASTNPSISDVQGYIADACAQLNGILVNKGYEIPIVGASNPDAFALLHSLAVNGAWAQFAAAAPSSPNKDRAAAAWTAAQKMLGDAQFVLNAPQDIERTEPRGPWLTSFPTGETFDPMYGRHFGRHGNPKNPYFSRTQRF